MAYILDADWVIQALAGRSSAALLLQRLAPQRMTISVVTLGELFEGAFGSANPHARMDLIREFLVYVSILPVTEAVMVRFAEIRACLRRRGQLISDFDIVIGAMALEYDLTVLTFNIRHLARIPELRLYQPS